LLSDNERDPIYLSAPQSWAERNPTAGVQKQRLRAKLTDAAKATKQITAARNRAQGALLTSDIEKFMTLKQTQIERIALAHSRKVSDIEKLINHSTNYRPSRAPSLANALTHKKMLEMNEGNANGLMSLPPF
jgi:K+-transporting ATPase c subunit